MNNSSLTHNNLNIFHYEYGFNKHQKTAKGLLDVG
ncbi:hypothetical protein FHS70_003063 [Flammeovirga yaeyamensis]|nr:hypothetical protein [Flammeovirga yaeyamensis]